MQPKIRSLLYDIQQACQVLEDFTKNKTLTDYQQNELLRAGVERKLMIIGEAVSQILRLDPEYEHTIPNAREIVGFRNILVHGYFAVQDETVWGIVTTDVPDCSKEFHRSNHDDPQVRSRKKII